MRKTTPWYKRAMGAMAQGAYLAGAVALLFWPPVGTALGAYLLLVHWKAYGDQHAKALVRFMRCFGDR